MVVTWSQEDASGCEGGNGAGDGGRSRGNREDVSYVHGEVKSRKGKGGKCGKRVRM